MIDYFFSLRAIYPYLGELPSAIMRTLALTILVILFSLPIGVLGAIARQSGSPALRSLGAAYVEFFRNIPALVLIYLVFFVVPGLGLRLNSFNSALVALVISSGAYKTEIFRAGIVALSKGQSEAAYSQGMTGLQAFRYVMLPQVLRTIYAPLGNQFIGVVHGTSVASVISVLEVTAWAENTGAQTFRFFETLSVAAIVYVCLCQLINLSRVLVGRLLFRRKISPLSGSEMAIRQVSLDRGLAG